MWSLCLSSLGYRNAEINIRHSHESLSEPCRLSCMTRSRLATNLPMTFVLARSSTKLLPLHTIDSPKALHNLNMCLQETFGLLVCAFSCISFCSLQCAREMFSYRYFDCAQDRKWLVKTSCCLACISPNYAQSLVCSASVIL